MHIRAGLLHLQGDQTHGVGVSALHRAVQEGHGQGAGLVAVHILHQLLDHVHADAVAAARCGQVNAVSTGVDQLSDDVLGVVLGQRVAQHLFVDAVLPLACKDEQLVAVLFLDPLGAGHHVRDGRTAAGVAAQDDKVHPHVHALLHMFRGAQHAFAAV